ncbi:hypothetical protein ECDEC1A_1623 [Escherichia coli DEC1A]|nr:hypothetical protein ECDEC1A_1623 [Escherichia coli DEC1A]
MPFFNPQKKTEQAQQSAPLRSSPSSPSVNVSPSPENKTAPAPSQKWCVIGRFNEVDGVKVVAWSCNNPVSFRGQK